MAKCSRSIYSQTSMVGYEVERSADVRGNMSARRAVVIRSAPIVTEES